MAIDRPRRAQDIAPQRRATTCPKLPDVPVATRYPAAAHSKPRPKIAPRWVFTPPVAAIMARSAAMPSARNSRISSPRAPAMATSRK